MEVGFGLNHEGVCAADHGEAGDHYGFAPDFVGERTGQERREETHSGVDGDQRCDRAERQAQFSSGVDEHEGPDHAPACGGDDDSENHQPVLAGITGGERCQTVHRWEV